LSNPIVSSRSSRGADRADHREELLARLGEARRSRFHTEPYQRAELAIASVATSHGSAVRDGALPCRRARPPAARTATTAMELHGNAQRPAPSAPAPDRCGGTIGAVALRGTAWVAGWRRELLAARMAARASFAHG
jgi:hypothetical protein